MGSAWDQLEQMLTCAICLDKYKNPKLLPCQHSFCGDACMEGLVDYARRQIKCPECRAEHRIPYQGVGSLPPNVTLTRFLELHARITGEDAEPVPTFMEKCSVCGEKVEGVTRCAHCEKKVCPECREAHVDLLKREIGRINNQSRRCLGKLTDFLQETLDKSLERLANNERQVRREIEDSCGRLADDLAARKRKMLEEVDLYAEDERKTLKKLQAALADELRVLESNWHLADERSMVQPAAAGGSRENGPTAWTDVELSELKDIFAKSMEFVRLFDPELGDFARKIRFNLIPEFEALKRRICEIGELRFAESACSLLANALTSCQAQGPVAQEICQAAASAAAAANSSAQAGLAHSSSNSNLQAAGLMLELPNALMRSQSDHRLASQFQQRLKQRELAAAAAADQLGPKGSSRFGFMGANSGTGVAGNQDSSEALRSRYAPQPRTSKPDIYGGANESLLTRDWPRPGDDDSLPSFGIHFKSAFMRRKHAASSLATNDDDDDLTSEASYGAGSSARNVRFYDSTGDSLAGGQLQAPGTGGGGATRVKLFDAGSVERAPLSGVPKLEDSPHLASRLHEMGARDKVDKRRAEEDSRRDRELFESAREAMNKAAASTRRQQANEEVDQTNKSAVEPPISESSAPSPPTANSGSALAQMGDESRRSRSSTLVEQAASLEEPAQPANQRAATSTDQTPQTPPSPGTRRSLYGQAMTEKSRQQLSSAIQDAASYSRRRMQASGAANSSSADSPAATGNDNSEPATPPSATRTKRTLRSSGRSLSKQTSQDQTPSESSSTGTVQRRRRLQQQQQPSLDSAGQQVEASGLSSATTLLSSIQNPKNSTTGSGGAAGPVSRSGGSLGASSSQLSHRADDTTEDNASDDDNQQNQRQNEDHQGHNSDTGGLNRQRKINTRRSHSNDSSDSSTGDDRPSGHTSASTATSSKLRSSTLPAGESGLEARNSANRRSREFMSMAMNKLLDRSAQIRRDSEEARTLGRGDSPQRTRRTDYSATTGYGQTRTSSGGSYATSRLPYQRSSTRDADDDEPIASRASLYSATSSSLAARKSSLETDTDAALRRGSNSSATSNMAPDRGYGSRRQDTSSIDSGSSPATTTYQSRFLARSRTSAALSSGRKRSQDLSLDGSSLDYGDSPRAGNSSYLSSRDRFLRESSSTSAAAAAAAAASSTPTGSSYGGRASSSGSSPATSSTPGPSTERSNLAWYMRPGGQTASRLTAGTAGTARSPFLELDDDDDEDDQYSAYLPSSGPTSALRGLTGGHHSEYLRSKLGLGRRRSSQLSSRDTDTEDDDDDNDKDKDNKQNKLDDNSKSQLAASGSQRRSSRTEHHYQSAHQAPPDDQDSSTDSNSQNNVGSGHSARSIYSSKRRMLFKLGARGSQPGQLTWPRGVAVGQATGAGRQIVVADSSNHRVQVFDQQGRFLHEFGSYGPQPGQFDCLAGVALNRLHQRYVVSDRYNHRVQVFDMTGRLVRAFGEHGREAGKLNLPWGVACDTSGLIYVCDKENHRVQVFDVDGTQLGRFGVPGTAPGQLQHPHYIAAGLGKVLVTDTNNHRVQAFDPTGRLLFNFGREGSGKAEFKFPRGIAMDEMGYIIVGDSGNNRLQIFTPEGAFIRSIGTWGSADGEFKGIEGVAVDSNNEILVCDRENHRIQMF